MKETWGTCCLSVRDRPTEWAKHVKRINLHWATDYSRGGHEDAGNQPTVRPLIEHDKDISMIRNRRASSSSSSPNHLFRSLRNIEIFIISNYFSISPRHVNWMRNLNFSRLRTSGQPSNLSWGGIAAAHGQIRCRRRRRLCFSCSTMTLILARRTLSNHRR